MDSTSTLKAVLEGGVQGYHPHVARAVGSVAAAIFLEHIAFWQGKSEDGWAFRTQEEIEERTALGRTAQESSRNLLKKMDILKEERKGVPARLYYRIDVGNLEVALQSAETVQTRVHDSRNQECTVSADYLLKEVSKEVSNPPEEEPATPEATPDSTTADEFISLLAEELRDATPKLTQARKARYGREFKEELKVGTAPGVLDEAVDRIAARWEDYQLSVEQAIRDCQNERTGANGKVETKPKSPLPEHEQWKEGYYRNFRDWTGGKTW